MNIAIKVTPERRECALRNISVIRARLYGEPEQRKQSEIQREQVSEEIRRKLSVLGALSK